MPDRNSFIQGNARDEAAVVSISDRRRGVSRWEMFAGLLLFAVVFTFHFLLEARLKELGAFELFNTLFNADPGLTLEAISSGGGGNHLSHPLLEYLFSIPIGAVAKVASIVSSGTADEVLTRQSLGLVVVPAATGLQALVLLRVLRRLGLAFRLALLLVLLGALSFSTLILGSMPESYCLSALCISLAYLLFLRTRARRGVGIELAWIALGVLTAGITVTNITAVAILYLVRQGQLGRGLWGRSVRAAGMAALALGLTLAGGYGLDRLFDAQPGGTPDEMVWISRYFVDDPAVQFATFPTAVVNGIVPPVPDRKPNKFALRAQKAAAKLQAPAAARGAARGAGIRRPGATADAGSEAADAPGVVPPPTGAVAEERATTPPAGAVAEERATTPPTGAVAEERADSQVRVIPFTLTLQRTHRPRSLRNYIGFALLAGLAWVALKEKRLAQVFRSLAGASLAIIAFNWALHGFWGGEQFLYSQHWHVSLLVLLGASVSVLEARRWNATAPLLICVVGVAVSNALVLSKVMQALAGD